MTRVGTGRAGLLVAVVALLVATTAGPARAATPDPATEAVSPLVWQACRAVGLVIGLTEVAGTLAGLPPDVTTSVNDVVAAATGPALTIFFEVCQQIPLPDDPPTCAVDAQVPALPYLGQPVLLAGLLANELRALDTAFTKLGVPLHGALSTTADDLLACAAGRDPSKPSSPAPVPASSPGTVPVLPDVAVPSIGGPGLVFPSPTEMATEAPTVRVSPRTGTLGAALSGAQPVSSSGSEAGRGAALALLAVGAFAALAWLRAGSPRGRGRGTAPEGGP